MPCPLKVPVEVPGDDERPSAFCAVVHAAYLLVGLHGHSNHLRLRRQNEGTRDRGSKSTKARLQLAYRPCCQNRAMT